MKADGGKVGRFAFQGKRALVLPARLPQIAAMLNMLVMTVLSAVTPAASAAPLQPTGQWHLYYLESKCAAERPFGDYIIGFEMPPLGDVTRLVIVGPGRVTDSRQVDSLIEVADGGSPFKASSLIYGTSKKGRRGITTVLPASDAARVSNSKWLRLSTLGTGPKSKRMTPTDEPIFAAEFNVGSTAPLAKELSKCVDDLRRHWGIVDGQFVQPATPAKLSLQGIFRSGDYPRDAMNAEQTGATTFLLMIDEKGAILDCLVKETSGVASLDAMGCQVIRERAKAKSARDAAGKPVKSGYVARVNWQISW